MPTRWSRRRLMRDMLGATAGVALERNLSASWLQQPRGREVGDIGRLAMEFKQRFRVPALSVAFSKNGSFVYNRAFGMADREHSLQADITSLFRIASVTKPITSVTIFSLIEEGKLHLHDKVFGPAGVLGVKYGKPPYAQYVADVTVDHLLTHTAGGWPNDSTDPMFRFKSWDHDKLIAWTLKNLPLTYAPGTHWAYSNFGYCVLGRVIEAVTGQSYESYVQAKILTPCGISNMRIAGNTERQRVTNEVVYYGQFNENPYDMNVTRMDSHGGWLATPVSLVQFLDHVAGSGSIPAMLKPETLRMMTTPAAAYAQNSPGKYARGWMVRNNGAGNWWHNGSLPGTTTIMVRTASGMCWAGLTNTRTQPSDEIDSALDNMMWAMARSVPEWGA